jgi:hypothetical protein
MARFQTVLKHARFVYAPYAATEMQGFAQVLADSIRARIQSGRNIYDQAAAPLKPGLPGRRGYPDYKVARGLQPIRDWTWSGHTLRCLKVLTANENRAAIGFLDETLPGRRQTASQIAFYNNQRERQWGVSPRDRAIVLSVMLNYRPLVTLQEMSQGAFTTGLRQIGFAQYMAAQGRRRKWAIKPRKSSSKPKTWSPRWWTRPTPAWTALRRKPNRRMARSSGFRIRRARASSA